MGRRKVIKINKIIGDSLSLKNIIKSIYIKVLKIMLNPLLKKEYSLLKKEINERPLEYSFSLDFISKLPNERLDILDIGTGQSCWPKLLSDCGYKVDTMDNYKDYWKGCFLNRHYYVFNDSILNPKNVNKYDIITCISTLEHIPNFNKAIENMSKLLKKRWLFNFNNTLF